MPTEIQGRLTAGLQEYSRREPVAALVRNIVGFDRIEKLLVGGVVRDAALGRSLAAADLDFLLGAKGEFLVAELARRLRRRHARLENKADETWRIVHGCAFYDFCILPENATVADNLAGRDFTVNAIGWDLRTDSIVDPLGGMADLQERVLRHPRADAFVCDPLRILRGARFLTVMPGFSLLDSTRGAMVEALPGIVTTAPERIREELLKILSASKALPGLRLLEELGIWSFIPGLKSLSICSADAWSTLEPFIQSECQESAELDTESLNATRLYLLVAARPWINHLEGGAAMPASGCFCDALRMIRCSNREIQFARDIHRLLEEGAGARMAGLKDGVLKSWIHRLQGGVVLLIAALDGIGARAGDGIFGSLANRLRGFVAAGIGFHYPRLITGEDLKGMGVTEGPLVGKILSAVQQGQYVGEITTRRQALDLALRWIDGTEADRDSDV